MSSPTPSITVKLEPGVEVRASRESTVLTVKTERPSPPPNSTPSRAGSNQPSQSTRSTPAPQNRPRPPISAPHPTFSNRGSTPRKRSSATPSPLRGFKSPPAPLRTKPPTPPTRPRHFGFGPNASPGPSRPRGAPSIASSSSRGSSVASRASSSRASSMTAESERTWRAESLASFDDSVTQRRPTPLPRIREPRAPVAPPPLLPLLPDGLQTQLANFVAAIGDFADKFGDENAVEADQHQDLALKVLNALFTDAEASVPADVVAKLGAGADIPLSTVSRTLHSLDSVIRHTTRGALKGYPSDSAPPRASEEARQRSWWNTFQVFITQVVDGEGTRDLRAGDVDEIIFTFGSMSLEDARVKSALLAVVQNEGTPGDLRLMRRLISAIVGVGGTVAKSIWR